MVKKEKLLQNKSSKSKQIITWFEKHQYIATWITAITAIPILITFILYLAGSLTITVKTNVASCVTGIINENEYNRYIDEKCNNISINQSISVPLEEVSKYLVISEGSKLSRFSITKHLDNTCSTTGNCAYYRTVSDQIIIR